MGLESILPSLDLRLIFWMILPGYIYFVIFRKIFENEIKHEWEKVFIIVWIGIIQYSIVMIFYLIISWFTGLFGNVAEHAGTIQFNETIGIAALIFSIEILGLVTVIRYFLDNSKTINKNWRIVGEVLVLILMTILTFTTYEYIPAISNTDYGFHASISISLCNDTQENLSIVNTKDYPLTIIGIGSGTGKTDLMDAKEIYPIIIPQKNAKILTINKPQEKTREAVYIITDVGTYLIKPIKCRS